MWQSREETTADAVRQSMCRGQADDTAAYSAQLTCDENAGDGIEVLHCHAREQVAGTNFAKVAQHRFLPRGACSCLCARARGPGQAAARAGPHLQRFQQQRPCDILRWARARGLQRIVPDDLDHKVAVLEAYHWSSLFFFLKQIRDTPPKLGEVGPSCSNEEGASFMNMVQLST